MFSVISFQLFTVFQFGIFSLTTYVLQSVAAVAKSVLNLAHEEQVLKQGLLHLDEVLKHLEPLHKPLEPPGGSVLLHELVSAPILAEATSNPQVCML